MTETYKEFIKRKSKNLKPRQPIGEKPKKRVQIVLDDKVWAKLKNTGNVSREIERLTLNDNTVELHSRLLCIKRKVKKKEKGYQVNNASRIIADLKELNLT